MERNNKAYLFTGAIGGIVFTLLVVVVLILTGVLEEGPSKQNVAYEKWLQDVDSTITESLYQDYYHLGYQQGRSDIMYKINRPYEDIVKLSKDRPIEVVTEKSYGKE